MGFFNFFKSNKSETIYPITNSIGTFSFVEIDGTKNYKGIINSTIGNKIELLFPINENSISDYQTDYFRKIEKKWSSIISESKNLKPLIDFENYTVVSIMIPDKENKFYDVDSEIVMQKKSKIISLILNDLTVDEVIEI